MRIFGATGTGVAAAAPEIRRKGAGTFTVAQETTPRSVSSAGLHMIGSIDALLALQGLEDPKERRRRAVYRGRNALDVLEELRMGLLSGRLDESSLLKLKSAAGGLTEESGDPALNAVLAEIEVRVEVELAKAGLR